MEEQTCYACEYYKRQGTDTVCRGENCGFKDLYKKRAEYDELTKIWKAKLTEGWGKSLMEIRCPKCDYMFFSEHPNYAQNSMGQDMIIELCVKQMKDHDCSNPKYAPLI